MRLALAIMVYIIVACLTGGNYNNHRCTARDVERGICGIDSVYAGALWPLYWPARAGIEVTR